MKLIHIIFIASTAGLVVGTDIVPLLHQPRVDNVRVFQRENGKPTIMRMYKDGRDGIYVEESKGNFIRLSEYLRTIPDKTNRNIEEELIKKYAEWYK